MVGANGNELVCFRLNFKNIKAKLDVLPWVVEVLIEVLEGYPGFILGLKFEKVFSCLFVR